MLSRHRRRRPGERGQLTVLALAFLGLSALLAVAVLQYADSTQVQRRGTAATGNSNSVAEAGAELLQVDTNRADGPACAAGLSGTANFNVSGQTEHVTYTVTSCPNAPSTCVLCLHPGSVTTTTQNSGVTVNLNAVDAFDATHVWAVGDNCTLLFYNGISWTQDSNVPPGCTANLKGVDLVDASDATAVGSSGTILVCTVANTCNTSTAVWTLLATAPTDGVTTAGSKTISSANLFTTANYYNGWTITDTKNAIPAGTTIATEAAGAGNTATMSQAATATTAGDTFNLAPPATESDGVTTAGSTTIASATLFTIAKQYAGWSISDTLGAIPAGTTVVAEAAGGGHNATISRAATATKSGDTFVLSAPVSNAAGDGATTSASTTISSASLFTTTGQYSGWKITDSLGAIPAGTIVSAEAAGGGHTATLSKAALATTVGDVFTLTPPVSASDGTTTAGTVPPVTASDGTTTASTVPLPASASDGTTTSGNKNIVSVTLFTTANQYNGWFIADSMGAIPAGATITAEMAGAGHNATLSVNATATKSGDTFTLTPPADGTTTSGSTTISSASLFTTANQYNGWTITDSLGAIPANTTITTEAAGAGKAATLSQAATLTKSGDQFTLKSTTISSATLFTTAGQYNGATITDSLGAIPAGATITTETAGGAHTANISQPVLSTTSGDTFTITPGADGVTTSGSVTVASGSLFTTANQYNGWAITDSLGAIPAGTVISTETAGAGHNATLSLAATLTKSSDRFTLKNTTITSATLFTIADEYDGWTITDSLGAIPAGTTIVKESAGAAHSATVSKALTASTSNDTFTLTNALAAASNTPDGVTTSASTTIASATLFNIADEYDGWTITDNQGAIPAGTIITNEVDGGGHNATLSKPAASTQSADTFTLTPPGPPGPLFSPPIPNFTAVWAGGANLVYAVATGSGGAGQIWACSNNCNSAVVGGLATDALWTNVTPGGLAGIALNGVTGSGNNLVFAVGSGGTVLVCTTNCATSPAGWTKLTGATAPPTSVTFAGTWAADANHIYAAGATTGGAGKLWACSAGCNSAVAGTATWTDVTPTGLSSTPLSGVTGQMGSPAWVVGNGGYVGGCTANCTTSAGGWSQESSGTSQNLYGVTMLSTTQIIAVGANGTIVNLNNSTVLTDLGGAVTVDGDVSVNGSVNVSSAAPPNGGFQAVLSAVGSGNVEANAGIYATGTNNCTASNCTPAPQPLASPTADPLTSPTISPTPVNQPNPTSYNSQLPAGKYQTIAVPAPGGPTSFSGTAHLAPGQYVITGSLSVASGSSLVSDGPVTLYFACSNWPSPCPTGTNGAGLTVSGTLSIQGIVTPGSSQIPVGTAIAFDHNNVDSITVGGSLGVSGSIDAPSSDMIVKDNVNVTVSDGQVAVKTLSTTAKTQSMSITSCENYNATTSGTSTSATGTGQTLVQPSCTGGAGIVSFDYVP
jgi:hypothetical protein